MYTVTGLDWCMDRIGGLTFYAPNETHLPVRLHDGLYYTNVQSWNTYPAHFFAIYPQGTCARACVCPYSYTIELLTVSKMVDPT